MGHMITINHRKTILSILSNPLDNLLITIDVHSNQSMNSLKGKVINETKFMINILTDSETCISIPKRGGKFILSSGKLKFTIVGELLIGNAKTRSKKKLRNW